MAWYILSNLTTVSFCTLRKLKRREVSKKRISKIKYGAAVQNVKWVPTWMLRSDLSPALFALPLFSLLLTPFLLIAVDLPSITLPDLTFLPLDGFRAGISAKLRLQHHHASPDCMTLPTGLVAL